MTVAVLGRRTKNTSVMTVPSHTFFCEMRIWFDGSLAPQTAILLPVQMNVVDAAWVWFQTTSLGAPWITSEMKKRRFPTGETGISSTNCNSKRVLGPI